MIKPGAVFTLLLFVATSVLAQEQKPDYYAYAPEKLFSEVEFYAGPGIGLLRGNTSVDNSDLNRRKVKISYAYGMGLNHNINDRFTLNNKLFFERKGGVSEITGTYFDETTQTYKTGRSEQDYSFHYYTLGISPTYTFGKKKRFRIGCGPYLSYLKKQTLKQTTFFRGSGAIIDETEYYRKFDFGVSISVSHRVPLSSATILSLELLNTMGLINTGLNMHEGQVMKTNNTSLLIGLILVRSK